MLLVLWAAEQCGMLAEVMLVPTETVLSSRLVFLYAHTKPQLRVVTHGR